MTVQYQGFDLGGAISGARKAAADVRGLKNDASDEEMGRDKARKAEERLASGEARAQASEARSAQQERERAQLAQYKLNSAAAVEREQAILRDYKFGVVLPRQLAIQRELDRLNAIYMPPSLAGQAAFAAAYQGVTPNYQVPPPVLRGGNQ